MRDALVLAAFGGLGLGLACGGPERFTCQTDIQCATEEVRGQCEAQGVCSFPDLGCESGQRFGERAGELAGMCVEAAGTGSTSDTGTGSGTASPETADVDTSGTGSIDVPLATTGPSGGDAYGSCVEDGDCSYPDAICLPLAEFFVCAPPCSVPSYPSDECPPDPMELAIPECVDLGNDLRCALSCFETGECPDGMNCVLVADQGYCVWV